MRAAAGPPPEDIRSRMDRMYRPQTLFYDLTRKHYLLGRDRLIAGLGASPGETVLEVGCGTGRNLALIGGRYPGVRLRGVDAAAPMLAAAARALRRRGLEADLRRGVAEELTVDRAVDHVVISYTLSMVDDPAAAVRAAVAALRPGGRLHVVDFGDQAGLPRWFGRLLAAWLRRFGVRHRPEVEAALDDLAAASLGSLERDEVLGRYALLFRFERAARTATRSGR